ncbi:MAG: Ni-sirohydrochlorin a,c-diamide reductive cyclase catalytic subunit [Methanomassiliicoccales archaeon]
MHPRPNPIIAAMYTLRDLEADVIVLHGPPGCGFTASRLLEEAGVRVVTTGMQEGDLIFGASDRLVEVLRSVEERFSPRLTGVVGTCASMIIGENLDPAIRKAGMSGTVLPVDIHGCAGPNTAGAIRVLERARDAGIILQKELDRQRRMLEAATRLEEIRGMTSEAYLQPHRGETKLTLARKVIDSLESGQRVGVVLNAKKETAFRFADLMMAVEHARRSLGGEGLYIGNLDPEVGLPRIRGYSKSILRDLAAAGVTVDHLTGGLDEYPVTGERASELLAGEELDLRLVVGLPHALPDLREEDLLVTDQPRQLRHLLDQGYRRSVGEVSTHSALMGATGVVPSETGDLIRQLADEAS